MTTYDLHVCRDFRYLDCSACKENNLVCDVIICTYCGEEKTE